jgi:manganese/iron transport system substrate-binding protein
MEREKFFSKPRTKKMLGILRSQISPIIGAATFAVLVGLVGCESEKTSNNTTATIEATTTAKTAAATSKKTKVVASHSVICDLVKEIAKDKVDLNCLINPDQDPHVYEGKPSDRQAVEEADIVFYAGLDFDPAIVKMAQASKTPAPKLALHDIATTKKLTLVEDGKTETDPHVWHDAKNGLRMVEIIQENLVKVDPSDAAEFNKNAQELATKIKAIDAWISLQIVTIPAKQRTLITTHDALGYYGNAYGLKITDTLQGISTEEEPTAAKVKSLTEAIKKQQVPVIFAEVTANDKVLKTVANEAKVKIADTELFADGLGKPDSPQGTYLGMLESNTCAIANGLGGKCTAFKP